MSARVCWGLDWMTRKRWMSVGAGFVGVLALGVVSLGACASTGSKATGARRARVEASPNFRDGRFVDDIPRQDPGLLAASWAWLTRASDYLRPEGPVPIVQPDPQALAEPPASGLRVTWFGHSTMLVDIDGHRVLIDPIWGERASPFEWVGPARFHPPVLALEALPGLDAVVISHDHYDHLDYPTVLRLIERDVPFVVPLGVGSHLEYWGVRPDNIVELDWWEAHAIDDLRLVATPSRHFSGRSVVMADKDQTLWAGWALLGSKHRAYFSGDTAMFPGFREIGERLGPFDVTMIESGAYNALWADVHLGPEQAVDAHRMARGKVMMPVHWGLFNLALHGWTEPMERVLAAAEPHGVVVATPKVGESFEPTEYVDSVRWWPTIPWDTADEAPVVSSGLEGRL